MTVEAFYQTYASDCTAGCGNQLLTRLEQPVTKTGRCWFRLSYGGRNYALLFSNQIDATYDDGTISSAGDVGGCWSIEAMRVGLCEKQGAEPACWHTVTFDGSKTKTVEGNAPFATDPMPLQAKAGAWLCYEITLTGACYPYHEEAVLTIQPDKQIPLPLMIGSDRPIEKRIGFLGDSITQGCGTQDDSYTHWVAKIAEGLPAQYSVWDLGIGYARANDAATNESWLARAMRCDTVHVCFGVNDTLRGRTAEQILQDLCTIVRKLKEAGCKVILLTLPPFDLEGVQRQRWQQVNSTIRESFPEKLDGIFDIAAVLGQAAPNEHLCIYGGHPDAAGCKAVADAYLQQMKAPT